MRVPMFVTPPAHPQPARPAVSRPTAPAVPRDLPPPLTLTRVPEPPRFAPVATPAPGDIGVSPANQPPPVVPIPPPSDLGIGKD